MKRTVCCSEKKLSGLMFGIMIGDAVGNAFNEKNPDEIPPLDSDYLRLHPPQHYTDDTQMAISVFEEMAENGTIDQTSLRDRFLARYTPWRGYGGGMLEVIKQWREGGTIDETATSLYNGAGNFGDGAAVRCAPVAAFFARGETGQLFDEVRRCSLITHTHPYGIAGALMHAFAVHLALNDVPIEEWIPQLFKTSIESAFKIKMGKVVQCLERKASAHECVKEIGNGPQAIEAVPAALYAALRYPDSFVDAVLFSTSMGGDSDTIAAMTGAISGARLSYDALPAGCIERLENGEDGRGFLEELIKSTVNR